MLSILIRRLVIGEVDCLAEYSDPVFYKNLFCAMEPRPEKQEDLCPSVFALLGLAECPAQLDFYRRQDQNILTPPPLPQKTPRQPPT